MVLAELPQRHAHGEVVVDLALSEVSEGPSWRSIPLSEDHVASLAESHEWWSPIVVASEDCSLVDGRHRLEAARRLGLATIGAQFFDGTPDERYIEFVRINTAHGLPLTLHERRDAAARILTRDPSRSDRSVARLCALSPRTVARIRGQVCDIARNGVDDVRVGRDGRARPVDRHSVRARIVQEIERNPGASLRGIARIVGSSPETVRSVARNLGERAPAPTPAAVPEPVVIDGSIRALLRVRAEEPAVLAVDPAFSGEPEYARFASLFDAGAVDRSELLRHIGCIPRSRVYSVADEARCRAAIWREFADLLETSVRKRP
jgi:hypothetical protein